MTGKAMIVHMDFTMKTSCCRYNVVRWFRIIPTAAMNASITAVMPLWSNVPFSAFPSQTLPPWYYEPEWFPHVPACWIDIHCSCDIHRTTEPQQEQSDGIVCNMNACIHANAENQRPKTIWLRYNRKPQVPNTIIHFHDDGADPAGAQLPRKARATAAMRTMATYHHACITHCDDIVRRQVSDRTGHTAPVMYNAGNAAKAGRRSKRGRRVRVAWSNRPIRCGRWPKTFPPKTSDGTGQDTPNASKPVVWSQLRNNRSMPTQRSRKRTSGNELHGFARAAWE